MNEFADLAYFGTFIPGINPKGDILRQLALKD
jgi:hypothetical protein